MTSDECAACFLLSSRDMRADTRKVSESTTRVAPSDVIATQPPDPIDSHVLVAACDDGVRSERERQLISIGLRVRLARTGFEAIVKACCHLPRMILLDPSLGSDEVEETSRMLSTCPSTAHIPIVKLTPRRGVPRRILQHLAAAPA